MARINYVNADGTGEPLRTALAKAPKANILSLLAHAETAFIPWLNYTTALMTQLELAPEIRELAILRVAAITPGADYEWMQHERIAADVGLTPEQIESARTGKGLDSDARLVFRFTEEVVRDATASPHAFALASVRFSPREIVELLLVIGHYMALARVIATTKVDLEVLDGLAAVDSFSQAGEK